MKKANYAIIPTILLMVLASCAGNEYFQEESFNDASATYQPKTLVFAKPKSGSLDKRLNDLSEEIMAQAMTDSCYAKYTVGSVAFDDSMANRAGFSQEIWQRMRTIKTANKRSNHRYILDQVDQFINDTAAIVNLYQDTFRWTRIFQLSHRGLLQHYMENHPKYRSLSDKKQLQLYGNLLALNKVQCEQLAGRQADAAIEECRAFCQTAQETSVRHRQYLAEELRMKQERIIKEEKQRLEKEQQLAKQQQEEIRRKEQARQQRIQKRKEDTSWLNGRWLSEVNEHSVIWSQRTGVRQYSIIIASNRITIRVLPTYSNSWKTFFYNKSFKISGNQLYVPTEAYVVDIDFDNGRLIIEGCPCFKMP